jgi:hypothetical protein
MFIFGKRTDAGGADQAQLGYQPRLYYERTAR